MPTNKILPTQSKPSKIARFLASNNWMQQARVKACHRAVLFLGQCHSSRSSLLQLLQCCYRGHFPALVTAVPLLHFAVHFDQQAAYPPYELPPGLTSRYKEGCMCVGCRCCVVSQHGWRVNMLVVWRRLLWRRVWYWPRTVAWGTLHYCGATIFELMRSTSFSLTWFKHHVSTTVLQVLLYNWTTVLLVQQQQ